ncbi:MAG: lysylphosphatidylglycerol synthase transmembrane domain-containing protein [Polyangiaceae bacterium]|jgi:glycosyltransferase 2 family protein
MANESLLTPGRGGRPWKKRAFAWGLALAALAFVVYAVPIRDHCDDPTKLKCEPGLLTVLAGARVGILAGLLALYFFATLAWAARWRALLALAKVPLGLLETWRITLEAQAGGILLPGGIGGDALRVGFVTGKGADLPTVIAAVLLDRAIGLVTVAALAAAFAATTVDGAHIPKLLVVLASIPVAFVAGLVLLRWKPLARAPFLARGPLAKVAQPVLEYLGEPGAPRAILIGLALSFVVSATQLLTIRGFVTALGGTPTSELWVYVGTTMAFIVGAIPALPGGWGTSDAAFVFFFAKAGLAPSLALAVSLVYRLFWYSSGGVGAVLYLLRSHASPRTE